MMEEFFIISRWYLIFIGLGIIGLGLSGSIFAKWHDKGYGLSKFLGLLIVTLPLWFLSSIKLIPFNTVTASLFYFGFLAAALYILWKQKFRINRYMLIQELAFLILFILWNAIRSTNSQIEGTEKFMNLAFMNSIDRTAFFPPADPWYSGSTINYYYFGHYMFVFLGKIGGVAMSYVYNLTLTTIIAYTFMGTMSLIGEFSGLGKKHWKWIVAMGMLAGTWLCFGSNLHYLYQWIDLVIVQNKEFTYWFPDGTRIIKFVIDEFPAYSIVLGDVHGHYLGMPFETLFMGLALIAFRIPLSSSKKITLNFVYSFALAAMYGVNTWDFIAINFIFILIHGFQALFNPGTLKEKLASFAIAEAALVIPGLIFFIPYFANFKPAVGGVGLVPLSTERNLLAYFQMWGMFLIIMIMSVMSLIIILRVKKMRFIKWLKALVAENNIGILIFLLNIAAVAFIIGVEVFYVRDIFEKDNGAYFRTNTVFKFYYIAWNLLAVVCSYYVFAMVKGIFNNPWKLAFPFLAFNFVLITTMYIGSVAYISEAVGDYYSWGKFEDGTTLKLTELGQGKEIKLWDSLDGNIYILRQHPGDYGLIQWIKANISGQPIFAEAVGEAYTYYSRISANTGVITPIGWPTHEWQWRDISTAIFKRKDNIAKMYTTTSSKEFTDVLNEFKIEYIVVGDKEREAYPALNEEIMKLVGTVVYDQENTRLYKLPISN